MGYEHCSIRQAINAIDAAEVFLPEIQRSLVWKNDQIEGLFDSLFSGYPVGTMLWWKLAKERIDSGEEEIGLRDFIKRYSEFEGTTNPIREIPLPGGKEHYHIVLDGQQRLTALAIAFLGSVARRKRYGRPEKAESYPEKKLYLNLDINSAERFRLASQKRFRFLSEEELPASGSTWYEVRKILRFANQQNLELFLDENREYSDDQKDNIRRLFDMVMDEDGLQYYEIDGNDYDYATELFLRLNSAGTPLAQTDLIFATLEKKWPKARRSIEKFLSDINGRDNRFKADKNFLFRAMLMLSGLPINMKGESFKDDNALAIEEKWPGIQNALTITFRLLRTWHFYDATIMSYNALLPLTYYIYQGGEMTGEDERNMRLFFIIAQLNNLFAASTNSILSSIRSSVFKGRTIHSFTLDLFNKVNFPSNKRAEITANDIQRFFEYRKGPYTFMLLSLLTPELPLSSIPYDQDHLHPYSAFGEENLKKLRLVNGEALTEGQRNDWRLKRDLLPNLQLLETTKNERKKDTPLSIWCQQGNSFIFCPADTSLDFNNFEEFFTNRKKLMEDKLREVFGLPKENINES